MLHVWNNQRSTPVLNRVLVLLLVLGSSGTLLSCTPAGAEPPVAATTPAAQLSATRYPPATPLATDVVLAATAGCPNLQGVAAAPEPLPRTTIAQLLTALQAEDRTTRQAVADPAYWPLLVTVPPDSPATIAAERIAAPQPARQAPQATLLAHACGDAVLARSWWVPICAGPCPADAVAPAESLTGHLFLLQREGQWLVWAFE